jgi:hypothetical protein
VRGALRIDRSLRLGVRAAGHGVVEFYRSTNSRNGKSESSE